MLTPAYLEHRHQHNCVDIGRLVHVCMAQRNICHHIQKWEHNIRVVGPCHLQLQYDFTRRSCGIRVKISCSTTSAHMYHARYIHTEIFGRVCNYVQLCCKVPVPDITITIKLYVLMDIPPVPNNQNVTFVQGWWAFVNFMATIQLTGKGVLCTAMMNMSQHLVKRNP